MGASRHRNGFKLDNSGKRVVVDPVTRIEGHMRCEVNLDENNVIRNAVSTGTMWRGLEVILKGRDPRDAWAFTERICGVCTGSHALTSVRAVEDALGHHDPEERPPRSATSWQDAAGARPPGALLPPARARLGGRGLGAEGRPEGDLANCSSLVSPAHPMSSPGYFRDVQNRLKKFVECGQLGPFMNGYWGNPAYELPPEANLMAVTHYLEALDFQKEIVKIHTIFGGKNPHPNYLVGGVPCAINIDGDGAAGAPINMERLNFVKARIDEIIEFIENVYIPDVLAIASFYKDWLYGGGLSARASCRLRRHPEGQRRLGTDQLPGGVIIDGNWDEILPIDLRDPSRSRSS